MAKQKPRKKEWTPPESQTPLDVWGLPDGHHIGYMNGFEKQNGSIYPAPMITAPMADLRVDREALNNFIDAINQHVHREMRKIVIREGEWWTYAERDLGIKRGDVVYRYDEQCFRKVPADTQEKPK